MLPPTAPLARRGLLLALLLQFGSPLHMGGYRAKKLRPVDSAVQRGERAASSAATAAAGDGMLVLDKAEVEFGGSHGMPHYDLLEVGFSTKLYSVPAGREHFVLCAALSKLLPGKTVVELGLGPFELGLTAYALTASPTTEVHSFTPSCGTMCVRNMATKQLKGDDIEEQWKQKVPNMHVHNFGVETLFKNCPAASGKAACAHKTELELLLGSSLLTWYCSAKPVAELETMIDYLRSWKYKGVILVNKIHEDNQVNAWFRSHSQEEPDKWFDVSDVGSKEGTALIALAGNLEIKEYSLDTGTQSTQADVSTEDEENLVPCVGRVGSDFMLNITEFIPGPISAEAQRQLGFNPADAIIRKDFATRNNPTDCTDPYSYVYRPYGMGACMHLQVHPFTQAYDMGKPYVLSGDKIVGPTKSKFCPSASVHCFFERASKCSEGMQRGGGFYRMQQMKKKFERYYVPEKYQSEGRFWWVAQTMAYILRLTKEMKDMVEATKRKIGYRHPIIAMQIRQGDSCVVRSACYGLQDFMKEANKMRKLYGVKRIFLATDSFKAISQTRFFPDWEIIYQDFDRSHFEIPRKLGRRTIDECHQRGLCDATEDVKTMTIDLQLMVEADVFIGGFTTNVARLCYELMVSRKGCYPPFVSLDIPWCHNNGAQMGTEYLNTPEMKDAWSGTSC